MKPFDALVLDLDGVFVDAHGSFRRAYREATVRYLVEHLGWRAPRDLVPASLVERLKRHPLMNDPGDTVAFLLLAIIVDACTSTSEGGAVSVEDARGIERGIARLEAAGGAVRDFRPLLLGPLAPAARRRARALLDEAVALRMVRERYAGRRAEEVYGFRASPAGGAGLYRYDRPLVDVRRSAPPLPQVVYTGRTRGEAQLVLARFRFFRGLPEERVFTKERGVRKPDPRSLREALATVAATRALYVGDLPADAETVRRLRQMPEMRGAPEITCALVGPLRRDAGADLEALDLGRLLDRLERAGLIPRASRSGRGAAAPRAGARRR